MSNVKRDDKFSQVCVWEGCVVAATDPSIAGFIEFMMETFDTRIQYLEEIETLADETGPGGRNDVFFAVHEDDISKFAVPRLAWGIRWVEDVLSSVNYRTKIYPDRVSEYCSWSTGSPDASADDNDDNWREHSE